MIYVPKGREVKIFSTKENYSVENFTDITNMFDENVKLILSSDFAFEVSSTYENLINYEPSTLQIIANQVAQGMKGDNWFTKGIKTVGEFATGQYEWMGAKIYKNTSGIATQVTVNVISDDYKDSWKKIADLVKLTVPKVLDKGDLTILGQTIKLAPLQVPGPNIVSQLGLDSLLKMNNTSDSSFHIKIGHLLFKNVVITKFQPVFSGELDSEGNPIWFNLTIHFESTRMVTSKMVDEIFDTSNKHYSEIQQKMNETSVRRAKAMLG